VALTARIARTQVTLEQLVNLKPGDIVPCDFDGRVTVYAEDVPILRGAFGVSHGQQAVKIEQRVARSRGASDHPVHRA
jgi:flagellar motor switch protein FliM